MGWATKLALGPLIDSARGAANLLYDRKISDLYIYMPPLEANNRFFYDSKVQRAGCNLLVNLCRDESTRTIVGNTDAMSHLFVIFFTEMGWPPDELRRQADELIRQRIKAETVGSACLRADTRPKPELELEPESELAVGHFPLPFRHQLTRAFRPYLYHCPYASPNPN